MDLGAIFLILAVALLVAIFVSRPFLSRRAASEMLIRPGVEEAEIRHSTLLAERDRILTALQDLEFDFTLGKIPAEDYPVQRAELLKAGADVLRQLDTLSGSTVAVTAEDRVESAVAARRADAAHRPVRPVERVAAGVAVNSGRRPPAAAEDEVEARVAARRQARQEKAVGFCPKCGRPVTKSDRFCSRCGTTL